MELSIIILLDYLFAYKVVYLFQSLRKWDVCGSVINSFKRGFFSEKLRFINTGGD